MIKDIIAHNETVSPNDREMSVLRENFPSCFKEDGSFDIERFKEFLSDKVAVTHEGYELKFLGKNYARLLAAEDTTTVISPDIEHNSRPENADSENIYISADNLDALKHLLKSYAGRVKCIYIDPPYNTGSDGFVYNDSFNFTADELSVRLSIDLDQAERILDLTKRGSASHSAWLMFMYPRLLLARDLLSKDGVIFISIDDNEHCNLKVICDEIFGENNFIADFPRVTKRGGKSSDVIALNHDVLLMYSKTPAPTLYPIEHNDADFKYSDEYFDERGFYKLNQTLDYDSLRYSKSLDYPLTIDGETFYPGSSLDAYKERQSGIHDYADWAWRWSKAMFDFGYQNGFIVIKNGRNGKRIYTKTYQKATIEEDDNGYYIEYGDRTKSLSTLEVTDNKYSNDNATKDIAETVGKKVFDHTKPIELISLIASLCTRNDDTILDFFSGSATTAEAIMRMNVIDTDIKRHWILVQLPELCKESSSAYKEGYRTICDIGLRRIQLTKEILTEEYPDTTADLGFKHYTLCEPSNDTLDKLENFTPDMIFSNLLDEFGVPTVLTTWFVRDGYGFTAKYETLDFAGYTAYFCGKHLYLIHEELTDEAIMAICEKLEADANFNPENIVLFGYSFTWGMRDTLQINVKRLKDTEKNLRINFDVRY